MSEKNRILSGIRSTGKLHIGHYFGILQNWAKLQDEADCFFMVADLHALTTGYEDTSKMRQNVRDIVIDILSAGIDIEKSSLFLQSTLPQHSEMSMLLSMITPLQWLYRNPTYKDMISESNNKKSYLTHGFLGYPVLMAVDILLYKANVVPIGEDQLPHLELTREIARRFNSIYRSNVLVEPKPSLTTAPKLLGTDGRKMSKSYNNCIYLSDDEKTVTKKVGRMVTDPARVRRDDLGHPEVCSVFDYHKIINEEEVGQIESQCRKAEIGCMQCKKRMAEKLNEVMEPVRQKRSELEADKDLIKKVFEKGEQSAGAVAGKTLHQVKKAMGLWI